MHYDTIENSQLEKSTLNRQFVNQFIQNNLKADQLSSSIGKVLGSKAWGGGEGAVRRQNKG